MSGLKYNNQGAYLKMVENNCTGGNSSWRKIHLFTKCSKSGLILSYWQLCKDQLVKIICRLKEMRMKDGSCQAEVNCLYALTENLQFYAVTSLILKN